LLRAGDTQVDLRTNRSSTKCQDPGLRLNEHSTTRRTNYVSTTRFSVKLEVETRYEEERSSAKTVVYSGVPVAMLSSCYPNEPWEVCGRTDLTRDVPVVIFFSTMVPVRFLAHHQTG